MSEQAGPIDHAPEPSSHANASASEQEERRRGCRVGGDPRKLSTPPLAYELSIQSMALFAFRITMISSTPGSLGPGNLRLKGAYSPSILR